MQPAAGHRQPDFKALKKVGNSINCSLIFKNQGVCSQPFAPGALLQFRLRRRFPRRPLTQGNRIRKISVIRFICVADQCALSNTGGFEKSV
jgi:hypothetical protein